MGRWSLNFLSWIQLRTGLFMKMDAISFPTKRSPCREQMSSPAPWVSSDGADDVEAARGRNRPTPRRVAYDPTVPSVRHRGRADPVRKSEATGDSTGRAKNDGHTEALNKTDEATAAFAPCFAPHGTRLVWFFVVCSVLHILLHGGIIVVELLGPFSTSKYGDTDQTWLR